MSAPVHHDPKGGFRNPWPGSALHGFGGFIRWTLTRRRRKSTRLDDLANLPASQALPPDVSEGLSVTWIGHSSFLIQFGGMNILTDPIWSDRASPVDFAGPKRLVPPAIALDALPRIDVVVVSHDHYDHLDDTTVRRLVAQFPESSWLAPLGVADFLRRRGAGSIKELDWWAEAVVGPASFACTPAQHFSGRYPWNRNATLWCGWTIRIGDTAVFFAGDTGLHPEFEAIARRLGPFDLSILPIGAYDPRWFMHPVHMDPEEAVAAFRAIDSAHPDRAGVMVGSHWGTFRRADEPVDEPPLLARQAWTAAGLPAENLWILAHGESRAIRETL
jgi:Predicted Zn-dependent hydrolases of the beta-lactamase fold